MNPADYLDVDSPAQRGKKSKKRRKVERNTKLSRSLDSLKELHGKKKSGCYLATRVSTCTVELLIFSNAWLLLVFFFSM